MRRFTQHNLFLKIIEKIVKSNPFVYKLAFTLKNNVLRNYFHESDLFGLKLLKDYNNRNQIIDVGANVGQTIDFFKNNFSKKIYAFEPNINLKKILTRKFKNYKNIKIFFCALSEKNLTKKFYITLFKCLVLHQSASLEKEEVYSTVNEFLKVKKDDISLKLATVKTKTLDSFKLNPFIIKIDCEGHELSVLKGMKKTLKHRPILFIENSRSNFSLLKSKLIKKYKYKAFGFDKNEKRFSKKKLSSRLNVYFIHEKDKNIKNIESN